MMERRPASAVRRPQRPVSAIYGRQHLARTANALRAHDVTKASPRSERHEVIQTQGTPALLPQFQAASLLHAVKALSSKDYACAHRAFAASEPSILSQLRNSELPLWLPACKYYTNYAVSAVCCGLTQRAKELFDKAAFTAAELSADGLSATLRDACTTNIAKLAELTSAEQAGGLASSGVPPLALRSSASIANEFFYFAEEEDYTSVHCALSASAVERAPIDTTIMEHGVSASTPPPLETVFSQKIVASLTSNARALAQLERSSNKSAKLRIIVSRSRLVPELACFFNSRMDADDLRRQLEMSVKGETAIDGGYGGVTNDVLAQFFDETGRDIVQLSVEGRSAARSKDVWFAYGALLVKCFVEGRSFRSVHGVLSCAPWRSVILGTSAGTSSEVTASNAYTWAQMVPLLRAVEQLSADPTAQHYLSNSIEHFVQRAEEEEARLGRVSSSLLEAFQDIIPDRVAAAVAEHLKRVSEPAPLQCVAGIKMLAGALAWDILVQSKLEVLHAIAEGVTFAQCLVQDQCLRTLLFRGADDDLRLTSLASQQLRADAVTNFCQVVGGFLQDGDDIPAKRMVSMLEFRAWGVATRTPYYLCSWLHHGSTREERRGFLSLCTGLTTLPQFDTVGAESPKITVVRSNDTLYARTCFFTLYLPSWEALSQDDAWSLLSTAVAATRLDRAMHEVDL